MREIKGAEFYFVVSEEQGRSTGSAIADILPGIVWSFPWPKSMRWPQGQGGYVRPLHNILLVFNGKPLNFMAGVRTEGGSSIPVNNITRGHRFLAPDSFEVHDFADYKKKLKAAKVILPLWPLPTFCLVSFGRFPGQNPCDGHKGRADMCGLCITSCWYSMGNL